VTWPVGFRLLKARSESGDTLLVDQLPGLNQISKPVYPAEALKDSLEGVVYLNVLVGQDGRVKQAEMTRGDETFKQAALDAMKASTWRPAMVDGKPVSVWTSFPVPFGIKKGIPPSLDAFIRVDEQPRAIVQPKPRYPESAIRDSVEGVVFLQVLIGGDGNVYQVSVAKAEANGEVEALKQAAIEAGRESEWFPAIQGGKPVAVWVAYPIRFTLKGAPPPGGSNP
jgi:protein TonB